MTHDESMRLFKYMQGEFRKIDLRFDKVEKKIDSILKAVDASLKQNETYLQDISNLNHKVKRHAKWINRVTNAAKA